MNQAHVHEFITFMAGYTDFFEGMAEGEKSKFEALASLDIGRMEQSIARQQATEKAIAQLEQRRQERQARAGLAGQTLSQIAAALDGAARAEMEEILARLTGAVERVRKQNEESMELVRENLDYISARVPEEVTGPRGYTPDKKRDETSVVSLFQKKI